MSVEVTIDARQFKEAAARLRTADAKLRRAVGTAIRKGVGPDLKDEVDASARRVLPGTLGDWVAGVSTLKVTQSMTSNSPRVTVVLSGDGAKHAKRRYTNKAGKRRTTKTRRGGTFGAKADLGAINRGRVMHPVFGHGPLVGPQLVTAGFFTKVMQGPVADRCRTEIVAAMTAALDVANP